MLVILQSGLPEDVGRAIFWPMGEPNLIEICAKALYGRGLQPAALWRIALHRVRKPTPDGFHLKMITTIALFQQFMAEQHSQGMV